MRWSRSYRFGGARHGCRRGDVEARRAVDRRSERGPGVPYRPASGVARHVRDGGDRLSRGLRRFGGGSTARASEGPRWRMPSTWAVGYSRRVDTPRSGRRRFPGWLGAGLLSVSIGFAPPAAADEIGRFLSLARLSEDEAAATRGRVVQDIGGNSVQLVRLPIGFKLLDREDSRWLLRLRHEPAPACGQPCACCTPGTPTHSWHILQQR